MPSPFHTQIEKALANAPLQEALDANAERRINARITAFASLPEDLSLLRQRAHQVRAQTIAHLDEYLTKFRQNAQKNGFIVHTARDAQEALQILLNLALQYHAKLIAKSK
ncbi:MAG: hypothetical protein ACPL3P_07195, partial [Anaerolineales bacterium]